MAPKKVSILEPPKEVEGERPFSPPPESPEEIKARLAEEREAEQRELDNAWKMIPYVDQKDLGPGNYAGMEMMRLLKPWQYVCNYNAFFLHSHIPFIFVCIPMVVCSLLSYSLKELGLHETGFSKRIILALDT